MKQRLIDANALHYAALVEMGIPRIHPWGVSSQKINTVE